MTETCDVLIGADGIKSAVRRQLYPEDKIKYMCLDMCTEMCTGVCLVMLVSTCA